MIINVGVARFVIPTEILRYDVHAASRAGDRHLLGVYVHLSTHQVNSDWM